MKTYQKLQQKLMKDIFYVFWIICHLKGMEKIKIHFSDLSATDERMVKNEAKMDQLYSS